MNCAMIVFYLIGYYTEADMAPIVTTYAKANAMLADDDLIRGWHELGVYPVIRPCRVQI
jgi:hypothetical protein